MREIKFRAWNLKTKRMVDCKGVTSLALHPELIDGGLDGLFLPFYPDLVLMQFTGFRDKTGKEIYEHDIFKAADGRIGTVAMVNGMWVIGNKDGVVELHWDADGGEVIGNIHENGDLLNGK